MRFDLDRLETIGQAVSVLEGIVANPAVTGDAQLAFSSDGTLVYVPGAAAAGSPIDWMTRDGKTSMLRAKKADWANPRFSPDGTKLAFEVFDGGQRHIWVYEWARDTLRQLTFGAGTDSAPVWTPNGQRIVFSSDRAKPGIPNLYWVNADGGEATRLTDSPDTEMPSSWHPSSQFLAFNVNRGATMWDLTILPMKGDAAGGWTPGKPKAFLSTSAREYVPMFSPDGRWIAYFSNEAGGSNLDVYVRAFPGPGGPWRISTEGGTAPVWSTKASELLFLTEGQSTAAVMVAPYTVVGDSFRSDTPRPWSPVSLTTLGGSYPFDLHPDGQRLAVLGARDRSSVVQDKVVFVSNFFDYLRTIAPVPK